MATTNAATGQASQPMKASALRSLLTRVEASIALVESHLGAIQDMPLLPTGSAGIHDETSATVADLVAKPLLPKDLASDDVLHACPALEPFVSGGLPGAQDMVAALMQRSDTSIHGDSSSEQSPGDGSDGGSDNGSGSGGDTSDGGVDSDGSDVGSRTSRSRRSVRTTSARTPSTGKRGARRSSRAAAGAKSGGAPKTTRLGARSRPQHQLITLWKSIHSNKYAPPFRKPVSLVDAPGYDAVIKQPMDLSTVKARIESGDVTNASQLLDLVLLICNNAMVFNGKGSDYYVCAQELMKHAHARVAQFRREHGDTADDALAAQSAAVRTSRRRAAKKKA